MPGGTGLLAFNDAYPDRLFDVGIAEEHAVSMAGGLAKQGAIPVVALYSTFLQRSFDQLMQDVSMLNLHVIFAVDRAGLVGEDGETHHGVFDVGFLRQAPGMQILCPASGSELSGMLKWAAFDMSGPVAIRYPRGGDGSFKASHWDPLAPVVCHRPGKDVAIVTYGTMVNPMLEAAQTLEAEGIDAAVIRMLRIHPLPAEALESALSGYRQVIFVEEASAGSGIGQAVSHCLREIVPGCVVHTVDLGSDYVTHGSVKQLYEKHGLDAVSIAKKVREVLARED
jgi:1-deoxy-D-xylulose-5-phosphate synthase